MFGIYTFIDWSGTPRTMRASTIHKKVIEASKKSNYNWIASATDLIYVCTKKNFPIEYSIDIKIAVLNCFSSLINSEEDTSYGKKTDIEAVYYAYNSLFDIKKEKVIKARINFLNSFLFRVRRDSWQFMFHHGDSFKKVCTDWQNTKLKELISIKNLDFNKVKDLLEEDFRNVIKIAEEKGIFAEDDKREVEIQRKIMENFNNFGEKYETFDKPRVKVLKP